MPHTKTPSDAVIVQQLEALGARWDAEAQQWIIPTDREPGLRRLLSDIGANVQWKGGAA